MNVLRTFFNALFGVIGASIGLLILLVALVWIFSGTDKETFSSNVKILPDAHGNRKELPSSTPVLLQINISGVVGQDQLTGEKIQEILLDSREDDFKKGRVKGLLLVINTPGGDVNHSDIIYRHLKQYKERYNVPIHVYVNGLCASGGYYIACAADEISASPVSLIGSIGVLGWPPFLNVTEAMKKIGVDALTLTAGKGKDAMNPTRPWTEGEEEQRQELIDFFYEDFVNLVVTNRKKISREQLVGDFGAKVFPAPVALESGYIDASGLYLSDAIAKLALAAGIKEDESYQVVGFETKSWWRKMIKQKQKMEHEIVFPNVSSLSFKYQ